MLAVQAFWLQHAPVLSVLLPAFTAMILLLLGESPGPAGQGAARTDPRLRVRRALALGSAMLGLPVDGDAA